MMNAAPTQNAHALPWMMDGLFPHDDQGRVLAAASVEVRPVYADGFGECVAMTRGDTEHADGSRFVPSFWSVYLRTAPDAVQAVADMPSEEAADAIAEALLLTYPGLVAAQGLHAPIRSWEIADAAQCLWEAYLTAEYPDGLAPAWVKAVEEMRESDGTSSVRDMFRDLARPCHVAYNRAVVLEGYDDSFDWEWCPAFLRKLDWSGGGAPVQDRVADTLRAAGFEKEQTGGGCEAFTLYRATTSDQTAAYIMVTGADGADLPSASSWMIGVYAAPGEEAATIWRSEDPQSFRGAVGGACATAEQMLREAQAKEDADGTTEGAETPTDIAAELAEIVEAMLIADARCDASAHAAALRDGAALMARIGINIPAKG